MFKRSTPEAIKVVKPVEKARLTPTASKRTPTKKGTSKKVDPIVALTEKYQDFNKQLNALIAAFRKNRESMIHHRKANQEVFRQVAALVEGSPLVSSINGVHPSYASVNKADNKSAIAYEDHYEEKIIDYAIEWEKVLALKFDTELKELQDSKREMEHYTKKVESLRVGREKKSAKGIEVGQKKEEKLERNEYKLEETTHEYEKHVKNLHRLVEDLVDRSWRDLCPLLVAMVAFDVNTVQDRATIGADLYDVVEELTKVASEHGLDLKGHTADQLWRNLRSDRRETTTPKSDTSKPVFFPDVLDTSESHVSSTPSTPKKLPDESPGSEEDLDTDEFKFTETMAPAEPRLDIPVFEEKFKVVKETTSEPADPTEDETEVDAFLVKSESM